MSKRIVVTGMGVVCPIGNNIPAFRSSLQEGKSGIDTITLFDATEYPSQIAGEVKDIDFNNFVDVKLVLSVQSLCLTDPTTHEVELTVKRSFETELP